MDATAPGPVLRRRGSWRPRAGVFAALVLAGILAQGCSDNNGRVTPTSAQVTGDALGGTGPLSTLAVQVTINPGTIDRGRRASVLVIVSNVNGIPLAGRRVQLAPTNGRLDQTTGVTDAGGLFSTTLFIPCEVASGAQVSVAAVVEGVVAQAGATVAEATTATSAGNDPCPPLEPEPAA